MNPVFRSLITIAAIVLVSPLISADAQLTDGRERVEVMKLLRRVPLIDGHNDVPWEFRKHSNDFSAINLAADTSQLRMVTDIPRLRTGGVGGQFWSVYVPATISGPEAVQAVLEQIDVVNHLARRYPDTFELAFTAADIERIHRKGKIASLIGMEGGHSINNSLATLRTMYQLGARYMTLTHTKNTDWADAAGDKPAHHGLTPFGEDVVREMNKLGMMVDLSHVTDETMRAALAVTKAPVIFSHSSARALCNHPRNVPDDILRMLPANGGIVMVCFVPGFLTEHSREYSEAADAEKDRLEKLYPNDTAKVDKEMMEWRRTHRERRSATLSDVANHIDHVRKVAGIDYIGIGSDFDGFGGTTKGLEDVSKYPELLAEFLRRGYSIEEIKKIAGQNLLRVMRKVEKVAKQMSAAAY